MSEARARFADALLAARLFGEAPGGFSGLLVRSRAGPVRERLVEAVRTAAGNRPWRRLPPGASIERVLGGLDLERTLATGRPVCATGLVAAANGGILVVPSAERLAPALVAALAAVLDEGMVRIEREGLSATEPARIGLLLLDEGEEETVAPALLDRVAFRVELDGIGWRDCGAEAGVAAGMPVAEEDAVAALAEAADAFGVTSVRGIHLALAAARALGGGQAALEAAARLVLAPRATRLPAEDAPPPPPEPAGEEAAGSPGLADLLVEAVRAALPPGVLGAMAAGAGRARAGAGGAGEQRRGLVRGRPMGEVPGRPGGGRRLALAATLRAAAPWQRLRGRGAGPIRVRADDLRLKAYETRSPTTTIFLVDASGSAAAARLAEAKGAVELLLAESYVRRDEVALVAFRNAQAEVLLPPTRSLARARRVLGGLPGGGGTPLAAGLVAARGLARQERARGRTPFLLVLTDGRANVALDGMGGRERAVAEALEVARGLARDGIAATVIDISPRPGGEARVLAEAMRGRHLALPRADARALKAAAAA
ncbi:magnesium chelatase subunit D [Thermaurantiacus sp.]